MTRMPQDPVTGKPLPTPPREDDSFFEEPTQKRAVPTAEELEAELYQHGGGAFGWERDRRPL